MKLTNPTYTAQLSKEDLVKQLSGENVLNLKPNERITSINDYTVSNGEHDDRYHDYVFAGVKLTIEIGA